MLAPFENSAVLQTIAAGVCQEWTGKDMLSRFGHCAASMDGAEVAAKKYCKARTVSKHNESLLILFI
jgi:hypothetical protein